MKRVVAVTLYGLVAAGLFWFGNTVWHDARVAYAGGGLVPASEHALDGVLQPRIGLSLHPHDLGAGLVAWLVAAMVALYVWAGKANHRPGEEHGSARWGRPRDLAGFTAKDPERNLLLTRTERLSIDRVSRPECQRNLNVLAIGVAGSGKSRNFVMPNLMQRTSSYLITDPKAELMRMAGPALVDAGYRIGVLNLVDFDSSDQFNPLRYLRPGHEAEDVVLLVRNLMTNTSSGDARSSGMDQFWEKAEAALLTALVAFVVATYPQRDRHLGSVVDLLGMMQASEDDESFVSPADQLFAEARRRVDEVPGTPELLRFATQQYRVYEQAAGKTAKSIIVTAAVRLAPLTIPAVRRLLSGDTLRLDQVGFEPTAVFMVISDTDRTFSFLASMVFSLFFQRGVYLADRQPDRRLPMPVHCWMDEFANIGKIPDFDVTAATLRSRGISYSIVIQNIGQGKKLYQEGWEAIMGNCDTTLFLGSGDQATKEHVSKLLGKETVVVRNSSTSRGRQGSFSQSRNASGRELLTPDEVGRIPGDEALCIIRGLPPFRSKKLAPVADDGRRYSHYPHYAAGGHR